MHPLSRSQVRLTHFVYEHHKRNFMELKTSLQGVCVLLVFSFSFPPSSGTVKQSRPESPFGAEVQY